MWCKRIPYSRIISASSWKVEFFCGETEEPLQSAFPVVTIATIVCERKESLEPFTYPDAEFCYIGMENVEGNTGRLVGFVPRKGCEVKSRSKVFKERDVLYGKLRPYLNKVYLAEEPVEAGICSTEFLVLIPDCKRVVPGYLRFILASSYVLEHTGRLQTGSALPRVHLSDIGKIRIPLPPLGVQRRIAEYVNRQEMNRRALLQQIEEMPITTKTEVMQVLISGDELWEGA